MAPSVVARFHIHLCPTCGARVGCTSAICDRQTAALAHPRHHVPELARLHRGAIVRPTTDDEQQGA